MVLQKSSFTPTLLWCLELHQTWHSEAYVLIYGRCITWDVEWHVLYFPPQYALSKSRVDFVFVDIVTSCPRDAWVWWGSWCDEERFKGGCIPLHLPSIFTIEESWDRERCLGNYRRRWKRAVQWVWECILGMTEQWDHIQHSCPLRWVYATGCKDMRGMTLSPPWKGESETTMLSLQPLTVQSGWCAGSRSSKASWGLKGLPPLNRHRGCCYISCSPCRGALQETSRYLKAVL